MATFGDLVLAFTGAFIIFAIAGILYRGTKGK